MEEEVSTMNGSESVLNSSFNSALSGFESLLRKQMGGDETEVHSSQTQDVREGYNQRTNSEVKNHERSRSPTLKDHYDRIDSGYHGDEFQHAVQYERYHRAVNGDNYKRDEYSSRNGDDRGLYNDKDFEAPRSRPLPMKGEHRNSWSTSKDRQATREEMNHQSSEQELDKYFDRRNSDKSMERGRRSTERLAKYHSDKMVDTGRAQSAERVNEGQLCYQNYGQRNNSSGTLSDNYKEHRIKHDLPPRGRSASPYRYNSYRDSSRDDNPYKEMDPKFRNLSPERSTESRDRDPSPHTENRMCNREYHSLPPNLPSSAPNMPHQRDPQDYARPLESSTPNNTQSHSQPIMRQPLVTTRTTPVSASARPPVNRALFLPNGNAENWHREVISEND